ncbi:oxidoreductase short-chain dehydrogenase reductase family protein [Rutstroemia sp. NJR-2017a BBW]|nr:oxidoreductase short-chain dehydrogenase reductase family protein [Rutstroemia sp. NJR-2017a BBW]
MVFTYKHILMVGATSGIGHAMAERLIEAGRKVTVVGRRKERLDEFVAKYGEEKTSAIPFDIGEIEKTPQFAKDTMTAHPTIDCIFLNAGIQNPHDFSRPSTVNLPAFNNEMHINYTSFVALTHAFLPYLLEKKDLDTSFVLYVCVYSSPCLFSFFGASSPFPVPLSLSRCLFPFPGALIAFSTFI